MGAQQRIKKRKNEFQAGQVFWCQIDTARGEVLETVLAIVLTPKPPGDWADALCISEDGETSFRNMYREQVLPAPVTSQDRKRMADLAKQYFATMIDAALELTANAAA